MHPLGSTRLGSYFEEERSHAGGRRTPNMQQSYGEEASSGSVFRSLFDMSEPTSAYFSSDVELNQSMLYGRNKLGKGLVDIWEHDRYFRLPTKEMAEEIRFKLHESEESTFLHPKII